MKTIKEKLMLVKLSQDLGMPVDADLLEEVTRYKDIQRNLVESVRKNSTSDLFVLKSIHEDSVAITEPIKEEVRYETPMPEVLTPPNLIDKAVQEIEHFSGESEAAARQRLSLSPWSVEMIYEKFA